MPVAGVGVKRVWSAVKDMVAGYASLATTKLIVNKLAFDGPDDPTRRLARRQWAPPERRENFVLLLCEAYYY